MNNAGFSGANRQQPISAQSMAAGTKCLFRTNTVVGVRRAGLYVPLHEGFRTSLTWYESLELLLRLHPLQAFIG